MASCWADCMGTLAQVQRDAGVATGVELFCNSVNVSLDSALWSLDCQSQNRCPVLRARQQLWMNMWTDTDNPIHILVLIRQSWDMQGWHSQQPIACLCSKQN
jgi:hypothetical protein